MRGKRAAARTTLRPSKGEEGEWVLGGVSVSCLARYFEVLMLLFLWPRPLLVRKHPSVGLMPQSVGWTPQMVGWTLLMLDGLFLLWPSLLLYLLGWMGCGGRIVGGNNSDAKLGVPFRSRADG